MPWLTLCGSNYPCLEQISMVPKMFEPLRFDCSFFPPWKGLEILSVLFCFFFCCFFFFVFFFIYLFIYLFAFFSRKTFFVTSEMGLALWSPCCGRGNVACALSVMVYLLFLLVSLIVSSPAQRLKWMLRSNRANTRNNALVFHTCVEAQASVFFRSLEWHYG